MRLSAFIVHYGELFERYIAPLLHPLDIMQLAKITNTKPCVGSVFYNVVIHVDSFKKSLQDIKRTEYRIYKKWCDYDDDDGAYYHRGYYNVDIKAIRVEMSIKRNPDGTFTEYKCHKRGIVWPFSRRLGRYESEAVFLACNVAYGPIEREYIKPYKTSVLDVWKYFTPTLDDLMRVYRIADTVGMYSDPGHESPYYHDWSDGEI